MSASSAEEVLISIEARAEVVTGIDAIKKDFEARGWDPRAAEQITIQVIALAIAHRTSPDPAQRG